MAQHLNHNNKLQSPRKEYFSVKFMEDLETLIGAFAVEICQWHIKVDCQLAVPFAILIYLLVGWESCAKTQHKSSFFYP